MRQKTTEHGEHLELMNDVGRPLASLLWWEGNPHFASLIARDGRLMRGEIEALHGWCARVLERMASVKAQQDNPFFHLDDPQEDQACP
jgi:hypothetical protein